MAEIHSNRSGPLVQIWAWVVELEDGSEGVVRRDTPIGTQPLVSDDLAIMMFTQPIAEQAMRKMGGVGMLKMARFVRVADRPAEKPETRNQNETERDRS